MTVEDPAYLELFAAVEKYRNTRAEQQGGEPAAVVTSALVVWEEVMYNEDGTPAVAQDYCIPSPGFSPAAALGLALRARTMIEGDLDGGEVGEA